VQAIAFIQAGYFSASQARQVGYSYQAQKYHADHGNWTRVDRGIFRLPGWPLGPDDGYVLWHLWARGQAVVSHDTALVLHDLSDVDPVRVHLTVPPAFRAEDESVVLHRHALADHDLEERQGFRVTSSLRTLLDVASTDLSQEHVAKAVAEALHRGSTTPRRLRSRADAMGDRAALRIERALTAFSVDGHHSAAGRVGRSG